jgi:membrane-bound lytic murein transglycosylase D
MQPTGPDEASPQRRRYRVPGRVHLLGLLSACALALPVPRAVFGATDAFPQPPELEAPVHFWVRVYTEIDTDSGFLHDDENLSVVYETLHFAPNASPRARERVVDEARDRYIAALKRIAKANGPLSAEDQRVRDLWGEEGTPARLHEATDHIRFQLGQADRFRAGLERSGQWETHIAETLASLGLPPELAVLPHVESSFNPAARSKAGAAGLWQFMRSTGRRYLRIDSTVDDRLDPFHSTEAAGQLLAYNFRLLGTWPLALTAYNHGAAGMRRAVETLGTDDIGKIVRNYRSPSFGFASRNFYASFLAALQVDKNPEKYFGAIARAPTAQFQEIALPARETVSTLERALHIDGDTLRGLNPALRAVCWRGGRPVPKGYHLRLPAGQTKWTTELVARRLGSAGSAGPLLASDSEPSTSPSHHRPLSVTRGGVLQPIPVTALRVSNADTYLVQRGDSLADIATKVGLPESRLLQLNHMPDSDFIFEGQHLLLADNGTARPSIDSIGQDIASGEEDATSGGALSSAVAPSAGAAQSGGGVPTEVAELESEEDAYALASVVKPAALSQPVSAAQEEALGPGLGPAAVPVTATTDPTDYSIAKDDTIVVAAAETLGHYADWLDLPASKLRALNRMRRGRPVVMGRRVKLDFDKVSHEQFEARRREYHRDLEASYFAAHRISGTDIYLARRGDSLWNLTLKYQHLPIWLLQQYNPDVDFSEMRPGAQIVVPRVEDVSAGG